MSDYVVTNVHLVRIIEYLVLVILLFIPFTILAIALVIAIIYNRRPECFFDERKEKPK
jgi:hypothetical protein